MSEVFEIDTDFARSIGDLFGIRRETDRDPVNIRIHHDRQTSTVVDAWVEGSDGFTDRVKLTYGTDGECNLVVAAEPRKGHAMAEADLNDEAFHHSRIFHSDGTMTLLRRGWDRTTRTFGPVTVETSSKERLGGQMTNVAWYRFQEDLQDIIPLLKGVLQHKGISLNV